MDKSNKKNYLEILYNFKSDTDSSNKNKNKNKKLIDFYYDNETCIKDLINFISDKYKLIRNDIKISYNKNSLTDDTLLLDNILLTNINKLSGEKLKIRVIPQINLDSVFKIIKFVPYQNKNTYNDSDENIFESKFDIIETGKKDFKRSVSDLFKQKMDELNYKVEKFEFFDDIINENFYFNNEDKDNDIPLCNCLNCTDETNIFYYLVRGDSVNFYRNHADYLNENEIYNNINTNIELRKTVSEGQKYKIIIQTYGATVREIDVYPEMTVGDLKNLIEDNFGVKKSYQELLYLVYKLKDNEKTLKDYSIRPGGIVFLRGFYFPLIFIDYYNKSLKYVQGINIAEQVAFIKREIILKLNLNIDKFSLLCNGKELKDDYNLIDYNIQKYQIIYIK